MNKKMSIATTTLQDCLTQNNRYAGVRLSADQLGAENLKVWNNLINSLHSAAYSVYAFCENNGLTVDSASVDKSAVYNAIREILAEVGEVNGHKLCANEELATLIIGYAGKRANSDSPELQLCLSRIRNRQKELSEYEQTNGVRPETIQALKDELEKLDAEKKSLLDSPDNRIKVATRTSAGAFRLDVEHRISRAISNQQTKTWEELEAEVEAKRKERRAKTKAKKAEKKAEEQKSESK